MPPPWSKMSMTDWLEWFTRTFTVGFPRPSLRADDSGEPWIRVRITYRPFACSRCKVAIKDGELVWSRGLDVLHDACRTAASPGVVHCWRCGQANRIKNGIAGARCGTCRAKLARPDE